MASRQHTNVPVAAIAAMFAALAIGSIPVAAMLAIASQMEASK
jgi:hypothetical protein